MDSQNVELNELNRPHPSTGGKGLPSIDKSIEHTIDVVHFEHQNSHIDGLGNVVYTNEEEEPEIQLRTWIALMSIYLLLAGQGLAFQGPPAVVSCHNYNGQQAQTQKERMADNTVLDSCHLLEQT